MSNWLARSDSASPAPGQTESLSTAAPKFEILLPTAPPVRTALRHIA